MWRGLPLRAWGEGAREFESLCRFGVLYLLQLLSILEWVTVCWFFSSQLSLLQLAKYLFLSFDVSILELENPFSSWEVFDLEWTSVCWFFSSQLSGLQLAKSLFLSLEVSVLELVNLFLSWEVPAFVFCDFAFHVIVLIWLVSIRLVLIWFVLLVVADVAFAGFIFLSRCVCKFCYQSLLYFVELKNKV